MNSLLPISKSVTPRSRSSGFSIIELMISITIGLVIITGLIGVLVSNSSNSKSNDRTAELQSNGRYALNHLRFELRHAGFRGYTWGNPTPPISAVNIGGLTECGGAGSGFVQNIRQSIWGAEDTNPFSANCINAGYKRGDVLVLRRVSGNMVTDAALADDAALVADAIYANYTWFRSTYGAGMVFQGNATPAAPTATTVGNFPLVVYVYYIGGDDADSSIPALRRVALLNNSALQDEMVVSGIEHMEVQYGLATSDGNTRYLNASEIAGSSIDQSKTDWEDVNSVRVWLLARNSKPESGYTNTDSYDMGDINYPAQNDSFRRQLFTAVVQLRN